MMLQVMFQIGHLCEEQGNLRNAAKWFSLLCTRVSTDPTVLARLGQVRPIYIYTRI
jgi:hypothetical protein